MRETPGKIFETTCKANFLTGWGEHGQYIRHDLELVIDVTAISNS